MADAQEEVSPEPKESEMDTPPNQREETETMIDLDTSCERHVGTHLRPVESAGTK